MNDLKQPCNEYDATKLQSLDSKQTITLKKAFAHRGNSDNVTCNN